MIKNDWKPQEGWVKITSKNGQIIRDWEKNLFVNTSSNILAGCLSGDTNKAISVLAIGDGGIVNSVLQTPTVNDSSLYSEIFRTTTPPTIITNFIDVEKSITFKFVVETNEGNGNNGVSFISEMGLFSTDGTMFSRKTYEEEIKTIEQEFTIEWKLLL